MSHLQWLLLTVSLLCLIDGGRSDPTYLITIPAMTKSGDTAVVCLNLGEYENSLHVDLAMQYGNTTIGILNEEAVAPQFYRCSNFTAPTVEKTTVVFLNLNVTGPEVDLKIRKDVVIRDVRNNCYCQMDKTVYKPGDKVQGRIFCLDYNYFPVNVEDSSYNRIMQILNPVVENYLISFTLQLPRNALSGYYTVAAESGSNNVLRNSFSVQEYIPPRFVTSYVVPTTISVLDNKFELSVTAAYTFNEPVPGKISARLTRSPEKFYGTQGNCFSSQEIGVDITGELDSNGTFSTVADLTPFFMSFSGLSPYLLLRIIVVEEGTGIQLSETRYISISSQSSLSFDYEVMEPNYKRGIPYLVRMVLTNEKSEPISNETIQLAFNDKDVESTVLTDSNGVAEYVFDTSDYVQPTLNITARYTNPNQCYYSKYGDGNFPTATYRVNRFFSESGSFIHVTSSRGELSCFQSHSINVQYTLTQAGIGKGTTKISCYILVMSRVKIVFSTVHEIDLTESLTGTFTFDLHVVPDMAPSANIIGYCILKKEIIAHVRRVNVEKGFNNQASLSFSADHAEPGSTVELHLSAAPLSICGVRVLDRSVLLYNPYEQLTPENVIYSNGYLNSYGYIIDKFNVEESEPPCEENDKQIFFQGRYYSQVSNENDRDAYDELKAIGLMTITDKRLRKPVFCKPPANRCEENIVPFADGIGIFHDESLKAFAAPSSAGSGGGIIETVRRRFDEVFAWKVVSLDSEGIATLSETLPDTATQWNGSMFCVSKDKGFGITTYPASIITSLPMLVEVNKEYSIIRGEILLLIVSVFNNFDYHIKINVVLGESDHFTATPTEEFQQGSIVFIHFSVEVILLFISLSKHRIHHFIGEIEFSVSAKTTLISKSCDGPNEPSVPHRQDTVIQTIHVEPEGIRKEVTFSQLVCPKDGPFEKQISITLPENVVQGASGAFVSVVGDMIMLTFGNVDNVLRMPYGCCEQTVFLLGLLPPLMSHLESTNQITEELRQTILSKMAQDEDILQQMLISISRYQDLDSGCVVKQENSFITMVRITLAIKPGNKIVHCGKLLGSVPVNGRMFYGTYTDLPTNTGVLEDVNSTLSTTAKIVAALSESPDNSSIQVPMLKGAVNCLKSASTNPQLSLLTQAHILYSLTLAKEWDARLPLLEIMKAKAISDGQRIRWDLDENLDSQWAREFLPVCSPNTVQISSLMILTIASGPAVTEEDLTYMAQISLGLSRFLNPYGGYCSSQDTLLALKAQAAFAKLTYVPDSQHNIIFQKDNADLFQISVNNENKQLQQKQPLPEVPGDYNIKVSGQGCVLLQLTTYYNILISESPAFLITAETSAKRCTLGVAEAYNLTICYSYQGSRSQTNMAIIDIYKMTGYDDDYTSVGELERSDKIDKAERQGGHLYLYLTSVTRESQCVSITYLMSNRVQKTKSRTIVMYDYYQTEILKSAQENKAAKSLFDAVKAA
ncbi:ovostatin-like [Pelodytes ibericus]